MKSSISKFLLVNLNPVVNLYYIFVGSKCFIFWAILLILFFSILHLKQFYHLIQSRQYWNVVSEFNYDYDCTSYLFYYLIVFYIFTNILYSLYISLSTLFLFILFIVGIEMNSEGRSVIKNLDQELSPYLVNRVRYCFFLACAAFAKLIDIFYGTI